MRWMSPCRKGASLTIGASKDSFKPCDTSVLLATSRALMVNDLKFSTVRSIPDVFYTARIYEIMIHADSADNGDNFFADYKTQIEYEWRTMLTLLVLSKTIDLPIICKPFPLASVSQFPLEKIAIGRLPKSDIWNVDGQGWKWENSVMFMLDDSPIAISSPKTIIVPAADAWDLLKRHYNDKRDNMPSWTRGWTYIDSNLRRDEVKINPVDCLDRDYAYYVWSWLNDYQDYIYRIAKAHGNCVEPNIARKLYANDLPNPSDNGIIVRFLNELQVKHGFVKNDLPKERFPFTSLVSLLPEIAGDPNQSDVRMDGGELFVDTTIVKNNTIVGGKSSNDIKVLGSISLKSLVEDKDKKLEILKQKQATVYFSDSLLQDKIWIINFTEGEANGVTPTKEECAKVVKNNEGVLSNFRIGSEGSAKDGCCWVPMPLTADGFSLLDKYRNADKPVVYNVTHENGDSTNIRIIVTIKIPMPDGNVGVDHGYYTYIHEYIGKCDGSNPSGEIMVSNVPEVCEAGIWPNRKIPGWKTYYLFCTRFTKSPSSISYIKPCDEDIAKGNNDALDMKSREFDTGVEICYYCLNKFPDYLAAYNGANNIIGYIPLDQNKAELQAAHDLYEAYIDFGTSATVIYRKYVGESAERFSGGDGLTAGTICHNTSPGSVNGLYFNQFFFPVKQIEVPFPSLLHEFNIPKTEKQDVRRTHVLDARIFFKQLVNGYQYPKSEYGRVLSNLKWSNSKVDAYRLDVYFQHLARMICLDAHLKNCSRVTICSSYPGAMENPSLNMERMKRAFNKVVAEDSDNVTFFQSGCRRITEGKAAAQKFHNTTLARCVIDIGGGSSDLFFVVKTNGEEGAHFIAKDSSIKFGARDVLVKILYKDAERYRQSGQYKNSYLYRLAADTNTDLFTEYANYISEITIRDLVEQSGTRDVFESQIEELFARPLFNAERETVGDRLHKAYLVDDRAYLERDRKFLTLLAINLAATVYYAGLLARNVAQSFDTIELSFAGNGSKMLKWLGAQENVEKFLRTVFIHARSRGDSSYEAKQDSRVVTEAMKTLEERKKETEEMKQKKFTAMQEKTELERKVASVNTEIKRLIKRLEILVETSIDSDNIDTELSELENRLDSEVYADEIAIIAKIRIALRESEQVEKLLEICERTIKKADNLLALSVNDLKEAEKSLLLARKDLGSKIENVIIDNMGAVKTILVENGKLVAAEGMSKKTIVGLNYQAYRQRQSNDGFDDEYNSKNCKLVIGGTQDDNEDANTAIIAGEFYKRKISDDAVGAFTADTIFDYESIRILDDMRRVFVSSGITPDSVMTEEFEEFCRAFNIGVMKGFGRGSTRKVFTLDMFTVPGEDIAPSVKVSVNTWKSIRADNIEEYVRKVVGMRESSFSEDDADGEELGEESLVTNDGDVVGTVDKKSLFFIEVQTLVDFMLEKF